MTAYVLLTLALSPACSKDAASPRERGQTTSRPAAARPKSSSKGLCAPRDLAVQYIEQHEGYRVTPAALEEASEHPDLDGDGVADLVLVYERGMANEPHYLFVRRNECYTLVGVVESFMYEIRCLEDQRTNGFCNVGTSWMTIRVESDGGADVQVSEGSTYAFDGEQYVKIEPAERGEAAQR